MSYTPRTDALRDSSDHPTAIGELWQFAATLEIELAAVTAERDELRAKCESLDEEVMRTWFVLKDYEHHPGRTDDRLSDCVRWVAEQARATK